MALAACAGSSRPDALVTTTSEATAPSCPPDVDEVVSRRVARDSFDVRSFDGVWLRVNLFAATTVPAPTLLVSPGWASRGTTLDRPSERIAGELAIDELTAEGYNVVSWDRRGAGDSGGLVAMGSPSIEGRDVATIVEWIAARPEVALEAPRDPQLGMFGGSYGGAIQLVAAAIDCRIDAIVPNMVGPSWRASLAPGGTAKVGWINLLYSSIDDARLEPKFVELVDVANHDGAISEELIEYLDARSADSILDSVRAPTLVLQGTVDSLFTLRQASAISEALRARDVPTAMIWYCGGHGNCPVPTDDTWMQAATVAWFDRYVRHRSDAPVVPTFSVVDQRGIRWTGPLGVGPSDLLVGRGSGSLTLDAASRSGPAPTTDATASGMANVMRLISPAAVVADHAIEVDVAIPADTLLVGAPRVALECRGTSPGSVAPTRVFAQLVDSATNAVVGGQVTPIPVELDGRAHRLDVDLESIVWHAADRSRLRLQIVASASLFTTPRLGGSIECDTIEARLPVTSGFVEVA